VIKPPCEILYYIFSKWQLTDTTGDMSNQ